MKVEGTLAAGSQAVRTDSMATVNQGPLVSADDETGEVQYTDRTGTVCTVTLGPNAIRITPKHSMGR